LIGLPSRSSVSCNTICFIAPDYSVVMAMPQYLVVAPCMPLRRPRPVTRVTCLTGLEKVQAMTP
jgi:hypothetical protein